MRKDNMHRLLRNLILRILFVFIITMIITIIEKDKKDVTKFSAKIVGKCYKK